MKKENIMACVIGYIATIVAFWIGIVAMNRDDLHGTVIATQQIELEKENLLENPELGNGLSFFWIEASYSRRVYEMVAETIKPSTRFALRQRGSNLYLDVWEDAIFANGKELTKRVKDDFPAIRDAVLNELATKGLIGSPKGEVFVENDESRFLSYLWPEAPAFALLAIPGLLLSTIYTNKRRISNQSSHTTPASTSR